MAALFQTTLVQHLQFGQNLSIKAQAEDDATWFNISLATGKVENVGHTNIGLHMLVSINEGVIVFKQCLRDKWKYLKSLDFDTKQFLDIFTLNIIIDEFNYHIAINDKPCIFVTHGDISPNCLNTLKINGHLRNIKQVDHRQHFPFLWPPIQLEENYLDFSNEQPVPFASGQVMIMKIRLTGSEKGRLILQLRNVWQVNREELHMSIRFDTKKIIWNSRLPKEHSDDLVYGPEECDNNFPFDNFAKPFKLAIAFTEESFKIAKNGALICNYAHRTPHVLGDVMGVKMFGVYGLTARVCSIEHMHLNKQQCLDFATYSIIKYN